MNFPCTRWRSPLREIWLSLGWTVHSPSTNPSEKRDGARG